MENINCTLDILWYERTCFFTAPRELLSPSMFFSQNRLSAKFRALRHEHLAATRTKSKPDLRSQRWIFSSSKPCAKRMNATQKRSEPPLCIVLTVITHISFFVPRSGCIYSHLPLFILILSPGEECIPGQFLGFPGLSGSFQISRFSSGRGNCFSCTVSICYLLSLSLCWTCKCLTAGGGSIYCSYMFGFAYIVSGKCVLKRGILSYCLSVI